VPTTQAARKARGAWYTPPALVDIIVDRLSDDLAGLLAAWPSNRPFRVLDPSCGDGRLLVATAEALARRGIVTHAVGVDIDADVIDGLPDTIEAIHADALDHEWGRTRFDAVVGNPPFLSQMAASTTRGGASRHGGGPYADAAAEFLALAVRLAHPEHGRIALVLPQAILGARDAGPVRAAVDELADHAWSWWSPDQAWFDASVNVCLVGLRRPSTGRTPVLAWTAVVTDRLGIPTVAVHELDTDGVLADRAHLNANFRDEYYALVGNVHDDADGPPLVTSGLIDPGRCRWGERSVRFAKQDYTCPRVDLDGLSGRFRAWADRKLVPKVLVANQTRMIEAVADVDGAWLPGVPVTTVTPSPDQPDDAVDQVAAVLTSPVASAICWHRTAGTGLSTRSMRLGPAPLGDVPWPAGDLGPAVDALARGDVVACGGAVLAAYGVEDGDALLAWWRDGLPG
jgi:SAM-dependent methyltransferase